MQVEAQAIARMNHPNIIGIQNLGLHEDRLPYYVMDLLDGESLADRLKRGSLTLTQALPIFIEVCRGLAYAHKKGIIHRDIKPGNIILLKEPDSSGATVKIVDFGIAKLSGASDPDNQNLTCVGEVFGSPYYMSPEQCEGKRIDARSDIYSVGCTLFESLVGLPPFRGNNPVQTMVMHQSHEPPTMSAASGKDFPDEIEELVYQLLAKAPMDRYQSLERVAEDLQSLAAGREIQTKALFDTHTFFAPEEPEEKSPAQNFAIGIAIATAAAVLVLVAAGIWFFQTNHKQNASALSVPAASQSAVLQPAVLLSNAAAVSKPASTTSDTKAEVPIQEKAESTVAPALEKSPEEEKPFSHLTVDKEGKPVKQFDFPSDNYLGRIFVNGSTEYWQIKGSKQYPVNAKLELMASPQLMDQVHYFTRFKADDLYGIHLFQRAMPAQKAGSNDNNSEFLLPDSYESDVVLALKNIQHMSGLKKLDLTDCPNANDRCIAPMNKLPNLIVLRASDTSITGRGLSKLARLKELTSLTYSEGVKVSTLLKAIAGSKKLVNLGLDRPRGHLLSLDDVKLIASCKNLIRLDLDDCNLDDESIAILATLPHLKMLYAHSNKISEASLKSLAKIKGLECADFECATWNLRCQELLKKQFPRINTVVLDE
ncbi:hypothetical protein BH11CYA1_BH11CYA1_49510 [soil metagenome]